LAVNKSAIICHRPTTTWKSEKSSNSNWQNWETLLLQHQLGHSVCLSLVQKKKRFQSPGCRALHGQT